MYIKQVDLTQALELAHKGLDIMVMAPHVPDPQVWTDYDPVMLQDLLDGCMFFRREPAMEKSAFDIKAPRKPVKHKPDDEQTKKSSRKKLDMGKVQALRKAGWSNKKIAEEMGVSEGTVWNRLKQEGVCSGAAEANAERDEE